MSMIRKIKRNKRELATSYRNSDNLPHKTREDTIDYMKLIARNDLPENHRGNIQKQVIKAENEASYDNQNSSVE